MNWGSWGQINIPINPKGTGEQPSYVIYKGVPKWVCITGFAIFFLMGFQVGFVVHWYFWGSP